MPTDENRRLNRETLRLAARYSELDMLLTSMLAYLPDNAKRLGVSGIASGGYAATPAEPAPALFWRGTRESLIRPLPQDAGVQ